MPSQSQTNGHQGKAVVSSTSSTPVVAKPIALATQPSTAAGLAAQAKFALEIATDFAELDADYAIPGADNTLKSKCKLLAEVVLSLMDHIHVTGYVRIYDPSQYNEVLKLFSLG